MGKARQERGRSCQLLAALRPLLVSVMGPFCEWSVRALLDNLSRIGGTAGQTAASTSTGGWWKWSGGFPLETARMDGCCWPIVCV